MGGTMPKAVAIVNSNTDDGDDSLAEILRRQTFSNLEIIRSEGSDDCVGDILDNNDADLFWFLSGPAVPSEVCLEKLAFYQDKYDADIAACNFSAGGFRPKGYAFTAKGMNSEEALKHLSTGQFPSIPGAILYTRKVLERIRETKIGSMLESAIRSSEVVCYYDEPLVNIGRRIPGMSFTLAGSVFTKPARKHDDPVYEIRPLSDSDNKIPITIGICAYNEEKNIERTIRSVFRQKGLLFDIADVLVVSSGSTDRTDDIVRELSSEFPKVKLIPQAKREGKNSAINLLFENKTTEIMVFLNADNVFENAESLDRLIEPFLDGKVGMVGGHPLPTNEPNNISGYTVQMMWMMHHYVAVQMPKTGELIAFRDIGTRLPTNMQSDEDILRMKLEEKGFRTVYAPEATILNRGPETVKDYIKQRTRVNVGENYLKKNFEYTLPTHNYKILIGALINSVRVLGFHPFRFLAALYLELYPRLSARMYVKKDGGDICVWDQVATTKKL